MNGHDTEMAIYRILFAAGALGMFSAAGNIWMRRPTSWRWFFLAIGICFMSMLVFSRMKSLENKLTEPNELSTLG